MTADQHEPGPEVPELDHLADAIAAFAGVRARIPINQLLRETALNVLVLSRIASNRLTDPGQRASIEEASDELCARLRQAAWTIAATPNVDTAPETKAPTTE